MHALYLLDVCWTFARCMLDHVNGVLAEFRFYMWTLLKARSNRHN